MHATERQPHRLREPAAWQSRRANGTSAAPAIRASRASPLTSASTGARRSTSRSTRPRRASTSTSIGWATTVALGARKIATVTTSVPVPQSAGLSDRGASPGSSTAAIGSSQRVWPSPATAVSGIYVAKLTRPDTGGASHIVFIVRDDTSAGRSALPDVRHDLAGLQPVRREQSVRRWPRHQSGRAYKVSYNRPFSTRGTDPRGLAVQRRIPDGSMARSERVRRQLRHRRRYRSSRRREFCSTRCSSRSVTTNTGRASQRANVEAARDAASTSRSSAATKCSGRRVGNQHRGDGDAVPDARLLQGNAREREDRPAGRTSGPARGATRDSVPPADGGRPENALTGTIFTVNCCTRHDHRRRRPTAKCASGATRASPACARRVSRRLTPGTLGLRVGRGPRQRLPPGRLVPAVDHDTERIRRAAGLRVDLRTLARRPTR